MNLFELLAKELTFGLFSIALGKKKKKRRRRHKMWWQF
jgi:hypothetical protein